MVKKWYEGLNNDITHRMLAAKSKVQHYRTYKYEWSLDLNKAGYCVCYWLGQYSDMKNNSISHKEGNQQHLQMDRSAGVR
jgi:hypothetical protein